MKNVFLCLPENGELGTSVVADPTIIQGFTSYQKDQFMLVNAKAGQPIRYYVGAGWTKNPEFKSKQDWLAYIQNEVPKLTF